MRGQESRPPASLSGEIRPNRDLGPWLPVDPCREMKAAAYPKGLHVMTIADKIENHQARCQPYVLRLRMIARDEPGTALTWQAVTEVMQATKAILAEAEGRGQ